MFAFGGAMRGHAWIDRELLENHNRLDIGVLNRVDALRPGSVTWWQWRDGGGTCVRATHGKIFLNEQIIRIEKIPLMKGSRGDIFRYRFRCPSCDRGCYHLFDQNGTFACRHCHGFDYRCRHRLRFNPSFQKIIRLRKKLGADPRPLSPVLPQRSWRRLDWRRLTADLARLEAALYHDAGRLLADLDQRAEKGISHGGYHRYWRQGPG